MQQRRPPARSETNLKEAGSQSGRLEQMEPLAENPLMLKLRWGYPLDDQD
ncbi:MAG: hypothetical protein K5872_12145 [Rhizobiaceae bacterium]|nr:hypothetical protein [Rhizobiaceae bacterium]MCV0406967.1 hypothetical protein [Rhizobiaceae bacterium]